MSNQPIKLCINPKTPRNSVNNQPRPVKLTINNTQPNKTPDKIPNRTPSKISNGTPESNYRITADEYQRYDTTRDHIYNITDTYIGSDEKVPRNERVLDLTTMTFKEEEISVPEGVERIFVEISSNAGDNVARSLRHRIDPGEVTIMMNREMISVRNGGIPIPIEIHPKEKIWAPELIFGVLHSSSNYDKNKVRTECGRNGYGAKLTNIFSVQFMVTIGDPNNKKWYRQVWNNNMKVKSNPEIKDDYDGEAFVEVVYKMDFERFGYKYYPDEAFRLFARHAADMSFTGKVPVSFNGIQLNVQNSKDYAKLYLGEEMVKNSILYYQWPANTKTVEKKNGLLVANEKGVVPVIEICAVDTPDNAINVSFVNGMWTRNGGVHADAAFKAISKGLLDTVNNGNSGKKKKKPRSIKLNITDVKRHVSMFVSCWLGDPKFDGQTKTALRSPTPRISIDDKILQPIMKWDLINRLYAELEAKQFRLIAKTDGRKKKYLSDLKGEDANDAGTNNSSNCTLYITEGKSAMSFAVKMLSLFEKGRDFIGLLPLKGKPLNVMNAPPLKIAENHEILEIKRMLGLRERVNYMDEENFKTLRYGHLMVLADADNDGKHILGLVLNLFHCKYPSLLARGYVKYLRTKIIDVRKGKQVVKFYTNHEYEEWKKQTPDWKKWEHQYFKGLGTSEDEDIREEFQAPKIVQTFYDDIAPMAMELAFHEKLADQRKEWIKSWQPDFKVEEMEVQPISAFINHEFIQFSMADVARSIPRFMDGLKQVQRKIIWGSMKKWGASVGSNRAAKVKVANLGSYVSDHMEYHHGDKSINGAIIHMVQDFTGANNLPYFCANGQFGCLDPKTPVILWNGQTVLAETIKVGDELVGDDREKRTVLTTVSGIDDMYEISQTYGEPYVVNSIHILTLMVTAHKKIQWKEEDKSWVMNYYDRKTKRVEEYRIEVSDDGSGNKDEAYKVMVEFRSTIPDDNVVDIPLNEYLELSQDQKDFLYGFKYFPSSHPDTSKRVTKIKVRKLGKGEYCGWTIDGNERFLLGDFTVTHNTRNMLGADAAEPRYSKTRPQWWWNLVFKKDDVPLLKMVVDEGEECEPVTLLPIIPLHLINGVSGIGTGHSTFIPNHDPLDICQWLTCKIQGYPLPTILPWYRGFNGNIVLVPRKAKGNPSKNSEESNEEGTEQKITLVLDKPLSRGSNPQDHVLTHKDIMELNKSDTDNNKDGDSEDGDEDGGMNEDTVEVDENTKYTMVTMGKFEITGKVRKKVIVTELPIGRSMHDYDKWLRKQREEKFISGYNNYSTADKVHFEITGVKIRDKDDNKTAYKKLRLTRSFGMSNMVLLDTNNRPIKYKSATDIMESFYALRLPYYNLRKENMLKRLQDKIDMLNIKIKFIAAVVLGVKLIKENPQITVEQATDRGALIVLNVKKDIIRREMEKLGFPPGLDLLKKVTLDHCTEDEIRKKKEELEKALEEKGQIERTKPESMWQDDIDTFVAAYCKHYKCKPRHRETLTLTVK